MATSSTDGDDNTNKKFDCHLSIHSLQNPNSKYISEPFDKSHRILSDSFPEMPYRARRKDENRTTVHFDQRMLFLSEVEFLTNACSELPDNLRFKQIVVIYAGAAPGNHIPLLAEMFPFVKFHLVDPAKFGFDHDHEPDSLIVTKQELFTNDMALELKIEYDDSSCVRLFISDIRGFGLGMNMDDNKIENEVYIQLYNNEHISRIKFIYKNDYSLYKN